MLSELERAGDASAELVELNGLGEVAHRAVLHGFHGGLEIGLARHEQHWQIAIVLVKVPQQLDAVHVRHVHVAHHQIERSAHRERGSFAAVPRFRHDVTRPLQHPAKAPAQLLVVVDEQHALGPARALRQLGFRFRSGQPALGRLLP